MSARRLEKALLSTLSSPPSGNPYMSKGSILVVDDESEIREGLELLLSGEGYGVSIAETGELGLGKLEERPYDLLLLDVSLQPSEDLRHPLWLARELSLARRECVKRTVVTPSFSSRSKEILRI